MSSAARALVAAMLACVGLATAPTPPAAAEVVWLCGPGVAAAEDPCEIPQDTTINEPEGTSRAETPERAPRDERPIDCFYVYPTVSNQPRPNATQSRDPELVSIANAQAARFSTRCRVFAPIYRQMTLAGIVGTLTGDGADPEIAYADVREAWRAYADQHQGGRGVVLLGHSQGSLMLRRLLRDELEPRGETRGVVGSVLLGGNVAVPPGAVVGGDFRLTPVCTRPAQMRCVVAFSTFAQDPGPSSTFGRPGITDEAAGITWAADLSVACTDPRTLAGTTAPLRLLAPTAPFAPGPLLVGRTFMFGPPPPGPTTWATYPDRFEGTCRTINGANVLRYDPLPGSRRPNFFPEPGWGTHTFDLSLALDPLVELVGRQTRRWTAPEVRLTRRCAGGRLRVGVAGGEAEHVRSVRFRVGGRDRTDAAAPFTVTFRRSRARRVRAIVTLDAGAERPLALRTRTTPRCAA